MSMTPEAPDDEQRAEIAPGRRHRLEIDADADDAVHAQELVP